MNSAMRFASIRTRAICDNIFYGLACWQISSEPLQEINNRQSELKIGNELMAKNLVIVESPAKAKTINKYLGSDYLVKASIGHIKDLPSKQLGVDIEHDFEPTYEVIPDTKKRNNKRIVAELKKAAKEADAVY